MSNAPKPKTPATANLGKNIVFWGSALAPTEDEDEFRKIHDDLREEHKPDGITEEGYVLQIAKLIWRRENIGLFFDVRTWKYEYAPFITQPNLTLAMAKYVSVVFDEYARVLDTIGEMAEKKKREEENEMKQMQADAARSAGGAGDGSAGDGREEIKDSPSLSPRALADQGARLVEKLNNERERLVKSSKHEEYLNEAERQSERITVAYYADLFTVDNFLEKINVFEAIERAIDRYLKRLNRLKEQKRRNGDRSSGRSRLLPPYERRRRATE